MEATESKTAATASLRPARSQALDDLIMGTNSSSITSKRSVEKLYYANEPPFFRYFVPKFVRRAPLVNRGYWLRLRAIDVVVRHFLESTAPGRKKVVINLGCGSDVLPWQCNTRYSDICHDAVFLDIDYPDLMRKKRAIVLGTPELRELLGANPIISENEKDFLLLRSEKYCQIGCDLRELDALRECLENFMPLAECSVLFVAEVSVTYMDTISADALIQWASTIGQAEFCLLEQILPMGPNHPFAKNMLGHFNKLNTSLKSVHTYPTLDHQKARFKQRGWDQVDTWDLWGAWSSDKFLTSSERIALDEIEPFDEWEEFVLFARHYFVMHARASPVLAAGTGVPVPLDRPTPSIQVKVSHHQSNAPKRRFGASTMVRDSEERLYAIHTLGLGSTTRLRSCDIYAMGSHESPYVMGSTGPSARMCHSMTDLGPYGILLVGGRGSPTAAFEDCWVFKKQTQNWERVVDLPTPLYRHSIVRLGSSSLCLVLGGKVNHSQPCSDYFVFHPTQGWLICKTAGDVPSPIFGAVTFLSTRPEMASGTFCGILSGGMLHDGIINTETYAWELNLTEDQPSLTFSLLKDANSTPSELSVFGAQTIQHGDDVIVCGGVGHAASFLGQNFSAVGFSDQLQVTSYRATASTSKDLPLMVGCSILSFDNSLIVMGGGATCYAMGTFWNSGVYTADITTSTFSTETQDTQSPAQAKAVYLNSPQLT